MTGAFSTGLIDSLSVLFHNKKNIRDTVFDKHYTRQIKFVLWTPVAGVINPTQPTKSRTHLLQMGSVFTAQDVSNGDVSLRLIGQTR